MRTFDNDDVTFADLLRDIVENQHLFKPFHIADIVENADADRRTVVVVESGNDGAGILMPEPEQQ